MENKTIRVWDKTINTCRECPVYNGDMYHCYYLHSGNFDSIEKDCPFSKPLSKEDIESCGFPLVQSDYEQLHLAFIINENVFITLDYFNKVKIFRLFKDSKEVLFDGTISNLPEFKLILKMLNIE